MSKNVNEKEIHDIKVLLFMLKSLRELHGMVKSIARDLERDAEAKKKLAA